MFEIFLIAFGIWVVMVLFIKHTEIFAGLKKRLVKKSPVKKEPVVLHVPPVLSEDDTKKISRTPPAEPPKQLDLVYEELVSETAAKEVEKPPEVKRDQPQKSYDDDDDFEEFRQKHSVLYGGNNLVAEAIKNLPKELKAMLIGDVLKRKDD